MQNGKKLIPYISLLFGAGGYFLRRWQLRTGFEADSGLGILTAPSTLALLGLTVLVLIGFLFLAWSACRGRTTPGEGYDAAFRADKPGAVLLWVLSCGLVLAAGLWLFQTLGQGLSKLILAGMGLLTGLCALICLQGSTRGRVGPAQNAAGCVPSVFFCYWMVLTYHNNITNPVIMRYGWFVGAAAFLALSWYYEAGYLYRRRKPASAVYSTMAAVAFVGIALADMTDWPPMAILLLSAAHRLVSIRSLLGNMVPGKHGKK